MSGTTGAVAPATPALHVANVTASPVSTIVGVLAMVQGMFASIPGGQLPTSPVGWVGLGLSLATGLFGAFAR